jgi:hypothetical protein
MLCIRLVEEWSMTNLVVVVEELGISQFMAAFSGLGMYIQQRFD